MHAQPLMRDLVRSGNRTPAPANCDSARLPEAVGESPLDPVITAAVLVTCAFRLRDEPGLIAALRSLAIAVEAMELAAD
jgi:hypothetical protein